MENPNHKEMIEEIKAEWKRMWWERIDDKVKAEGIANEDFSLLFIEQGTVVFATRSFRPPDLREIIEQHRIPDADRVVPPNPAVGGWASLEARGSAPSAAEARLRPARSSPYFFMKWYKATVDTRTFQVRPMNWIISPREALGWAMRN